MAHIPRLGAGTIAIPVGIAMLILFGAINGKFITPPALDDEIGEAKDTSALPGSGPHPVEILEETSEYRIVRHAAGTTRVPAVPQRVCALAAADELLSIGILPVAHSIQDGNFPDYLAEAFKDVPWIPNVYGAHMPNMEAIVRVRPDLIICRTPSLQTYRQLSKIAPVVVLLDHLEHYRQRVLDVGTIVGRRPQAEARVAWYNAKVAAARQVLQQKLGDQSMALIRIRPKSYRLYGDQSHVSPVFYGDLAVKRPWLVGHRGWNSAMSPESLLHVDADYLIIAPDGSIGSDRTLADLAEHPIWQRVPAVKNQHVLTINKYRHWADAGILGRGRGIDDVITAVAPGDLTAVSAIAEAALRKGAW